MAVLAITLTLKLWWWIISLASNDFEDCRRGCVKYTLVQGVFLCE
jgi:hypothetical protein